MDSTLDVDNLKQIKYYLIGTITEENKKAVNRQLRGIDKRIKEIKSGR